VPRKLLALANEVSGQREQFFSGRAGPSLGGAVPCALFSGSGELEV
jgi:hypothetical protein